MNTDKNPAVTFSDGAIKFILYFAFASIVPTFAVALIAADSGDFIWAVVAVVVMVVTDVAMMWFVRQREKRRQESEAGDATHTAKGIQLNLAATRLLVGFGLVFVIVGIFVNATSDADSWIAAALGLVGAVLMLAGGYRARR
jgi:Na+/melibiose symporter-like transporter